jgi:ABC-type glucose/galactose transport system permease subunit
MRKLIFQLIASIVFVVIILALTGFVASANDLSINVNAGMSSTVLTALLAVYEVVVRVFPTVKNWSIISKILALLTSVSDALNNKAN